MIRSRLEQTNSLINSGDFITIKTPYPINPDDTIILGYYLITNDVVDYQNTIFGQFCIVKESEDKIISENNLVWEYLHKTKEGDCEFLKQACAEQIEPYYIYFKFTKLRDSGQIINIDKVSLKIADKRKNKRKFFYYDKSIFKEIDLYNSSNLNWAYSVLDKIKSKGDTLPNFIDRGKDFTIFWGWICHFFAVIVNYGRQFLNIFNNKNLFLEFLKQKDVYKDIRVDLYEDLISNIGGELFYNPILGYKITNHYVVEKEEFIYSDLLDIKENNLIKLKISNSNKLDFDFNIDVDVAFYDNKKAFVQGYTVELNKDNLTTELIIERNKNINYVAISYKPIYKEDEIYLINIYNFGKGTYGLKDVSKEDLLNIYKTFRKRGTKFSENSIKSLCKTELNDSFFSNYLNHNNIGWILNKSCPIISYLSNFEKINQIVIDKLTPLNTGEFIEFQDNIIAFSDINVINIKWNRKEWDNSDSVDKNSYIKKITIFCSLYNTNKKAYYPPQNQVIINGENLNGIVIDNIPNYKTEINIPIQLIENISQKNIINNFIKLDYRDICVFTHLVEDNSILEFIKIKAIYFGLNNQKDFVEISDDNDKYINNDLLGIYFKNISEGIVKIKPTCLGIGKQNKLEFEFPSQDTKDKIFIENILTRTKNKIDTIQTDIDEHTLQIQFDCALPVNSNINIYIYYINTNSQTGTYNFSLSKGQSSETIKISDIRTTSTSDILQIALQFNTEKGSIVYDDIQMYYLSRYCTEDIINTCFDGFKVYYENNVKSEKYLNLQLELANSDTFIGNLNKGENSVLIPINSILSTKNEVNKIIDIIVKDEKNQEIIFNKYLNSNPIYIQEYVYHNLVCIYDILETDLENGYKKVPIFENTDLLGVILVRLNNLYKENDNNYNIQQNVTKRNYLFYENLSGKYDYIPENALVDFGDAFSYYLKPGDVLEHGNSYTTLFDEEINSSGEVVKSKFDSLECNFSFYKLPYNLGFINIQDYYLTYYKNHGQYSNKELENIINLKFLPYHGYKLFLNSSKISSSIYKPMKFLSFEITNPLDWNSSLGKIDISWKGGCPNYKIIIKGKILQPNGEYEDYYLEEDLDKTKYSKDLNNGIYFLIIKDNLEHELNKGTFYIVKPDKISYNLRYYILGGNKDEILSRETSRNYDEIYISLNGGTPPYKISYTNSSNQTSILFVENGRYILLEKIKAPRNTEVEITVTDSNEASDTLTLKNNKYFEMYDNGEGTCQLIK